MLWFFRNRLALPLLEGDDGATVAGAASTASGAADGAGASAPAATSAPAGSASGAAVDLAAVRELVIAANPTAIPEMVVGSTLDELVASAKASVAVHERIAASLQQQAQPPRVPASGGAQRSFVVNVEELSSSAKISEGLRQRRARS